MGCHITVNLTNGDSREFNLSDTDLAGLDARAAQDWLGQEFEAAGCTPTNPVGKLLLADKVLVLAKTRPAAAFSNCTPWVKDFLRATACAIGRPVITIDLSSHSLGY